MEPSGASGLAGRMEATSNWRLACSGVGRLGVWARAVAVRDRRMRPSGFIMCSRLFSVSEFLRDYKQTRPPRLSRAISKGESDGSRLVITDLTNLQVPFHI